MRALIGQKAVSVYTIILEEIQPPENTATNEVHINKINVNFIMSDIHPQELKISGSCSLTKILLTCLILSMAGIQITLTGEKDLTMDVTRSSCGSKIDLQEGQDVFLSYEGQHFDDDDDCQITLYNSIRHTEICMKKSSMFSPSSILCARMFSGHTDDSWKYSYYQLDWNYYVCYLDSGCGDAKTLRLQFNTKTWDDNVSLALKIYVKRGYRYGYGGDSWSSWSPSNTYGGDSWSSWSSSNDYDDYDDDDDDDEPTTTTIVYILIIVMVFCCSGCFGYAKTKWKNGSQNGGSTIETRCIPGTNQIPTSQLAPNATFMQTEGPPEFHEPSVPPDYNTLFMQYEQDGTGFIPPYNDATNNQNGLSNSRSNLESQNNQENCPQIPDRPNVTENENRPPPPDYYDVVSNIEKYKHVHDS